MSTTPLIRRTIRTAVAATAAVTVTGSAVAAGATAPVSGSAAVATGAHHQHTSPDAPGALTTAQRRVIRQATQRFRDIDTAIAAGYQPTDVCVELPGAGGMGYHYVHPQLSGDANIDPALPEVLVYAPARHGRRQLAAIEYLIADADGDLGTDTDRPTLFGEPFDGPMEGHEPGMPVHYDLHTWVWKNNPAGELDQWNPTVNCP